MQQLLSAHCWNRIRAMLFEKHTLHSSATTAAAPLMMKIY
jgi:hypothetical protein